MKYYANSLLIFKLKAWTRECVHNVFIAAAAVRSALLLDFKCDINDC
jgi:hypothetical protein